MKVEEALKKYLGPADQEFNIEDLTGPYGGLINVLGLRHKNVIAAGQTIRRELNEAFDTKFYLYDVISALVIWCSKYTSTETKDLYIGRRTITRGAVVGHGVHYFCVPANRGLIKINNL